MIKENVRKECGGGYNSVCTKHFKQERRQVMYAVRFTVVVAILCFTAQSISAEVIGKTDKEVQTIAEPILDNILESFETNDYNKYSKDFDDTLKETITEERFLEIARQIDNSIGNYKEKNYLGFLTKGRMTLILWKAKFDKTQDDVLIKLVMSKRGGRYLVTGLWFQ